MTLNGRIKICEKKLDFCRLLAIFFILTLTTSVEYVKADGNSDYF